VELNDLQQQADTWARRNCKAGSENWAFDHAAKIAEEAGELLRNAMQGRYGFDGTEAQWRRKAQDEIGDVIVAACNYASAEGFDVEECVQLTLSKLAARDGNYKKGLWTH
jgi:NTP pyrophosphatase (non-canonical NTP hydrolase)